MILLIDNFDSFTYNVYQYLVEIGPDVLVKRNNEITLQEIEEGKFEAIILSPGPCTPKEAGICIELIKYFSGKLPILGICLGHQAVAAAFGARIIEAKEMFHGKASLIEHQKTALFFGIKNQISVGRYHSLIVENTSLPDCFTVTAKTEDNTIMAIQHRSHLTFGLQFHPESILTSEGKQILKNFINLY